MKIEQEDKNLIKAKGKHTLQTESQGENANILTKNVAFSKQIIFSEKLLGPFNAMSLMGMTQNVWWILWCHLLLTAVTNKLWLPFLTH